MSSKWSVIPLTVIGSEREIRSGGIIFASSNSHKIFRWILSILVNDLPSKDKIHTICSDDDLGLPNPYGRKLESAVFSNFAETALYNSRILFGRF